MSGEGTIRGNGREEEERLQELMVPFRKRLQYVPGGVGSHAGAQKRPDAVVVEGGNEHGGDAAGPNDVRPRSLV